MAGFCKRTAALADLAQQGLLESPAMAKQSTEKHESAEKADFEAALGELEKIVETLESGELSLADSLEGFKRGVTLSKRCHQLIDEARQSVEVLSDVEDESSASPTESPAR